MAGGFEISPTYLNKIKKELDAKRAEDANFNIIDDERFKTISESFSGYKQSDKPSMLGNIFKWYVDIVEKKADEFKMPTNPFTFKSTGTAAEHAAAYRRDR